MATPKITPASVEKSIVMTNPKNSATPKTVAEKSNSVTEAVIDGESVEEIAEKVKKTIPTQTTTEKGDDVEPEEVKGTDKLSLVQRFKTATGKLAKNRKALLLLGASAVIAGLAVKNSRKAIVMMDDTADETATDDIDETSDSL
jgi:hypothetical protein